MELLKSSIAAFNQTTSTTTLATILLNDLQAFNDSSEVRTFKVSFLLSNLLIQTET